MKYVPDMEEDDAKALFRQHVPKSFLTLQLKCHEYVQRCQDWVEAPTEGVEQWLQNGADPADNEGLIPVMNEEEFRYWYVM